MKRILIIFAGLFLFIACQKVPVTGRRQLSLVSQEELLPMSFQSYKDVLASNKLSDDEEQTEMLRRVGNRIQAAVEEYMAMNNLSNRLQGFEWEFNLIDNDTLVNAWAMPGGKVAFYTGIMPLCENEVGIAVVMGHEVAHAIANHGGERMSQGMVAQFGIGVLQVAMGQDPSLTQEIFLQSVGLGTQLGILKFSRTHESEADHLGLIFMAMAGYNPSEAPKFWERMQANSGGQAPPEWLSTHPSHETRIKELNEAIPEAMTYYKPQN